MLVVGQVALALALLVASGLLIRTFLAMQQVEPGFTGPKEVQTFVIAIPPGLIADQQVAARTHESVADRLAQVPGVDLRRALLVHHDGRRGQRQLPR